jgi:hypothetical protein
METPVQQCLRLLAALEDLVAQESHLIGAENYEEVIRVQERAAPIVERLVALAPAADAGALRQASGLIERRRQNQELMARHVERTAAELDEAREARSRLTHFAPAYRVAPPATVRRLRALG